MLGISGKLKKNLQKRQKIPKGTGKKPGILINNPGEVLICNYKPGVTL